MPKKKARMKKEICDPDIWAFLTDSCFGKDEINFDVFLLQDSRSEQLKLWNQYRDEILERWISEMPGTRPNFWWRFDAPVARKKVNGEDILPVLGVASYRGIPQLSSLENDTTSLCESEPKYLKRNNLFVEGEEKGLSLEDFEPFKMSDIVKESRELEI